MAAKAKAQPRKATAGLVLGWIFGLLFILASLGATASGATTSGVLLVLAGVLLLPPAATFLRERLHLSTGLRVVLVLVLFVIAMLNASTEAPVTTASEDHSGETPQVESDAANAPGVNRSTRPQLEAEQRVPPNVTYASIRYDDLMRHSDTYRGSHLTYKGEVRQVLGGDAGEFELLVAITHDGFLWKDTVLVDYVGERVLEDDLVNITGRYDGLQTYKAVGGGSETVPRIVDANVTVLVKAGDRP